MATEGLLEIRLKCLDEESAKKVVEETEKVPAARKGSNSAIQEGSYVVISYSNKMWPYDIADMAADSGLASDEDAAAVFACL